MKRLRPPVNDEEEVGAVDREQVRQAVREIARAVVRARNVVGCVVSVYDDVAPLRVHVSPGGREARIAFVRAMGKPDAVRVEEQGDEPRVWVAWRVEAEDPAEIRLSVWLWTDEANLLGLVAPEAGVMARGA